MDHDYSEFPRYHEGLNGFRYRPTSQPSGYPTSVPSITPFPPEPEYYNYVILIIVCMMISCLSISLLLIFFNLRNNVDDKNKKVIHVKSSEQIKNKMSRTVDKFFREVVPLEFHKNQSWLELLKIQLIIDHSLVNVIFSMMKVPKYIELKDPSNHNLKENTNEMENFAFGIEQFLILVGKTCNHILVSTVLILYTLSDDGSCSSYQSANSCRSASTSYTLVAPLCRWTNSTVTENLSGQFYCTGNPPDNSFLWIISLVTYTLLGTIILDKVVRFWSSHSVAIAVRRGWMDSLLILIRPKVIDQEEELLIRSSSRKYLPRSSMSITVEEDGKESEWNQTISSKRSRKAKPLMKRALNAVLVDRDDDKDLEDGYLRVIGDEFQVLQSKKATILRAAAFRRMTETIDYVPASQELRIMVEGWMVCYNINT